jgi:hypothetical protein
VNRESITLLKSLILLFLLISAAAVPAQIKDKSWTEWSKKDAEKILSDSPWAQTQIETDLSEMFYVPTGQGGPNARGRLEQGATNIEVSVKFRIRFFSARPIRQALIRLIELDQGKIDPQTAERMHGFAQLTSNKSIIVAVTFEASDKRAEGKLLQLFASANTGTFKNNTYLERSDGKRLFLEEYTPPGRDGFGARFIFHRVADDKLFISSDAGEIRFSSQLNKDLRLNVRFKPAEMVYNGALEY